MHKYRAYAMNIISEYLLPELLQPANSSIGIENDATVYIRAGRVPEQLFVPAKEDWTLQARGEQILIRVSETIRILVERGEIVTVSLDENTSIDDARTYVVGSGLAAAAHQRGLLPMHVSALAGPTGAIAFAGPSGAGKSTMAAHLHQQSGWPLISDDVSVFLRRSQSEYEVESGVRTVKLWGDALESLNRSSEGLKRDMSRHDKFHAIDADRFSSRGTPLARLVFLEWGERYSHTYVEGIEAVQIMLKSIYRPEIAQFCHTKENLVASAISICEKIKVEKLIRPKSQHVQNGVLKSINEAGITFSG